MMPVTGGKQRLCIAGWLLAALALVAFNGYLYLSLEDQPISGYSPTIKMLNRKLDQFEQAVAFSPASHDLLSNLQLAFARYDKQDKPDTQPETVIAKQKTTAGKDRKSEAHDEAEAVVLPTLSGIVQIQNPPGDLQYMALLDGRLVRRRDRIERFTVSEITPQGVVLSGMGRQWTIASPVPTFTQDLGK